MAYSVRLREQLVLYTDRRKAGPYRSLFPERSPVGRGEAREGPNVSRSGNESRLTGLHARHLVKIAQSRCEFAGSARRIPSGVAAAD
jgi:hypothetical protein